ncbi:MAG TPA: carboxypeptidase-like regulatory domain-containing protein, partial [Flavitalea sp.]|nr:carboxypeptidase-like regulatory domain-containing protein [Flavitalea sp.]
MRKIINMLACLLLSLTGFTQERTVTGSVKDQNNAPVIGATVTVKGTTVATQTNATGTFSIPLADGRNILVVSYVGSETQEVRVIGQEPIIVSLKSNANALADVVVTGYSSQRKQDVTGAVAVVDLTPVKNNSSGNTMQALQGRVAGLYIEKDGSPNGSNSRILIR